jgi:hypothetical protein
MCMLKYQHYRLILTDAVHVLNSKRSMKLRLKVFKLCNNRSIHSVGMVALLAHKCFSYCLRSGVGGKMVISLLM